MLVGGANALAEDQPTGYVCVVDEAVGFKDFDRDKLIAGIFIPAKYVFKWGRNEPGSPEAWLLRELGSDFVSSVCGD